MHGSTEKRKEFPEYFIVLDRIPRGDGARPPRTEISTFFRANKSIPYSEYLASAVTEVSRSHANFVKKLQNPDSTP